MNGITPAQTQTTQSAQGTNAASGGRKLNDTTAAYLTELKQKHPDVNITIASFANEKQFDSYIFGCSGNNNLVIAPNILDKMATDPAAAAKYERVFSDLKDLDKYMKEYEKNDNAIVYASGAKIDQNGKVSFWGISGDREPRINPGTVFKDKIQKQIAETQEKDRVDKSQDKKRLEKAESTQKLLEQISASAQGVVPTAASGENVLDIRV